MHTRKAILIGFLLGVGTTAALFVLCSLLFVDPHWDDAHSRVHPKGSMSVIYHGPMAATSSAPEH